MTSFARIATRPSAAPSVLHGLLLSVIVERKFKRSFVNDHCCFSRGIPPFHLVGLGPNALRIRSKAGGTRVCRRACLLQPLVVRRFAPNSKGMAIRSALSRARSVLDNAGAHLLPEAGAT